MIAAFIRTRGVTRLPGFGDPALAALNAERERQQADERSWSAGRRWRKSKRARP